MNHLSLQEFDGIAFDVEGTLADTLPVHHAARLAAFDHHGFGDVTPEQHALGPTYGSYPVDIIGGVLRAAGHVSDSIPPRENPIVLAVVQTKTDFFEEAAAQGFDAMPGALEFFDQIHPFYLGQIALVTSSEEKFVAPFVKRHGLDQHIPPELTITQDTISSAGLRGKPSPDPYLLATERLNTSKLLVFEDTVPGVASAKQADATVIGLGFDPENAKLFAENNLEFPPDAFVGDYTEATKLLGLQ